MPGIDSLEPLAKALGLSVSEILSGRRLTAEELPAAAGGQIVESLQERLRLLRGLLATLFLAAVLTGIFLGYHYFGSAPETDLAALSRKAEEYLGTDAVQVVETERRGDYLAALCTDGEGQWCLCVYDRDTVFPGRWRAGGGKPSLDAGTLGSWNFGNPREAVVILCGGELPEEAACYTFQNSGITYTCPIRDRRVLDIFLLPESRDISAAGLRMLDEAGSPLDGGMEGAAEMAP